MDDAATTDSMGIRASVSSFSYSSGQSSARVGAGILNKPIGDFFAGNYALHSASRPEFAANNGNAVQVRVSGQIIPEPEEYALVFGLFALGFVILRRHFHKKKRQQAPTS